MRVYFFVGFVSPQISGIFNGTFITSLDVNKDENIFHYLHDAMSTIRVSHRKEQ
jgi:hypothetical protein